MKLKNQPELIPSVPVDSRKVVKAGQKDFISKNWKMASLTFVFSLGIGRIYEIPGGALLVATGLFFLLTEKRKILHQLLGLGMPATEKEPAQSTRSKELTDIFADEDDLK